MWGGGGVSENVGEHRGKGSCVDWWTGGRDERDRGTWRVCEHSFPSVTQLRTRSIRWHGSIWPVCIKPVRVFSNLLPPSTRNWPIAHLANVANLYAKLSKQLTLISLYSSICNGNKCVQKKPPPLLKRKHRQQLSCNRYSSTYFWPMSFDTGSFPTDWFFALIAVQRRRGCLSYWFAWALHKCQ